jgi:hypothetical protein
LKHIINSTLIILLCIFSSCDSTPENVSHTLQTAGTNRTQLDQVIDHYKSTGENEKLKAAYFLIGNMGNKYSQDGEPVRNFDVLFDILDSLHRRKVEIIPSSPLLRRKWDSLVTIYGKPNSFEAENLPDKQHIRSAFLIENIDMAFNVWKEVPENKRLSFEQFCEYLLPYRMGNERLESWRTHLHNKYKVFKDTVNATNRYEFTAKLNADLRKFISVNHTMRLYPYDMTILQMEKARRGACKHLVFYTAAVLRSMGIPVGIDYTPTWGDLDRGHEWNTLLMENGKMFPFNAAASSFTEMTKSPYRFSKVYRVRFGKNEVSRPPAEEVPEHLVNEYDVDVTDEYTKTYDLEILLKYPHPDRKRYAVIATFGKRDWQAQSWGEITGDVAKFKKMGSNLLYIVMYYDHGRYYPATDPFVLEKNGAIRKIEISNSKPKDLVVVRKYPYMPINAHNGKEMIGAQFQGANKPDFSDADILATVPTLPLKMETMMVKNKKQYRYLRYLPAKDRKANLAELEFFSAQNHKLTGRIIGYPEVSSDFGTTYQMAFDRKLDTYFNAREGVFSWAGLDLTKPQQITSIRYAPRSDTNFILVGDNYELKYWNGLKWLSQGNQIAVDQQLTYQNVPSNGVYILYNKSRGNESRIFTYEQGQQIWW